MSKENVWKKVGENSVSIEEGVDKMIKDEIEEIRLRDAVDGLINMIKEELIDHESVILSKYVCNILLSSLELANKEIEKLKEACRSVIPCLEDWVRTTGFGAVYKRDKAALMKITEAMGMEVISKETK